MINHGIIKWDRELFGGYLELISLRLHKIESNYFREN